VIITGEGYCLLSEEGSILQDRHGRFALLLEKDTVSTIERESLS
jgi:hypothetical protein